MTSALSIKAHEAYCLIDGVYSCFLRQNQVVITDGIHEWVISQSDIDELEEQLEEQMEAITELETELNGKASSSHTHGFSDIIQSTTNKTLDEVLSELQLGTSPLLHTHEFANIYKTETITNQETQETTTINKSLEQVLNERESVIRTLISGKANVSHSHNATEIVFNDERNVKQELDRINSRITKTTEAGAAIDIFDVIFGTAADAGLQYEVSTLQGAYTTLQSQVAGLAGTYGVNNTTNQVRNAADEISNLTDVAQEGRTWVDSLKDWFSSFKNWLTGRRGSYTQLVNNYTPPELLSVSNESALYVL